VDDPGSGNLGWSVSEIFSILSKLGKLNINNKPAKSNRNAKNRFEKFNLDIMSFRVGHLTFGRT
jgi:hypothetical protein